MDTFTVKNKKCPFCGAVNPPIKIDVGQFHTYEYCRNVIGTRKLFGIFTVKKYCNNIVAGEELGLEFDCLLDSPKEQFGNNSLPKTSIL